MRFLFPLVFILFAVIFSGAAERQRPNVVLILSDDQGWGDYGFMGHAVIETPHLDRVAASSLLFENGYVVSPLCRPSLASIVTGLHPHQHGVVGNDVSPARRLAREAEDRPVVEAFHRHPSLIRFLTKEGYLSFQTGKWWEGSWKEAGFSGGMTHGDPERGGRHGDVGLEIGRKGIAPIETFLDQAAEEEKPFFLWYAPFLPHTPHNPPERLVKKYTSSERSSATTKYFAMCEWFDETCGSLLEALDQREMRKNTIVVYICDNGWQATPDSGIPLPEGWWPGYAPKSKGAPYELGVRTPIFFSFPDVIEAERRKSFASSIDLFPTILSLCGFEAPESVAGMNLMNRSREEVVGAAYSIHNMTPGAPFDTLQYSWFRQGPWKFLQRYGGSDTTRYRTVHEWDKVPVQLFHLEDDPHETNNVANQHADLVREFQATLNEKFPLTAP